MNEWALNSPFVFVACIHTHFLALQYLKRHEKVVRQRNPHDFKELGKIVTKQIDLNFDRRKPLRK